MNSRFTRGSISCQIDVNALKRMTKQNYITITNRLIVNTQPMYFEADYRLLIPDLTSMANTLRRGCPIEALLKYIIIVMK